MRNGFVRDIFQVAAAGRWRSAMASFGALLEGAEMSSTELFMQAWTLWGANVRAFTADPAAASAELQAASTLFGFLSTASADLSTKQQGQVQTVLNMLGSLMVMNEPPPPPAPAPAAPQPKEATHYAGSMRAPDAAALPAPSLLFGKSSPPAPPAIPAVEPSPAILPKADRPAAAAAAPSTSKATDREGQGCRLLLNSCEWQEG